MQTFVRIISKLGDNVKKKKKTGKMGDWKKNLIIRFVHQRMHTKKIVWQDRGNKFITENIKSTFYEVKIIKEKLRFSRIFYSSCKLTMMHITLRSERKLKDCQRKHVINLVYVSSAVNVDWKTQQHLYDGLPMDIQVF